MHRAHAHMWPHRFLDWHRPPTSSSASAHSRPRLSLALRRGPGLPRLHRRVGVVHATHESRTPGTSACPEANVLVPPTTPQPLLPAHSAVSPTSMSHFPRAPSDKFIKLRDDTVNGHIKKEEKRRERGEKSPGASHGTTRTHSHTPKVGWAD